jgi:hypothetical protein
MPLFRTLVSGKTQLNTVQRIATIFWGAAQLLSGTWITAMSLAGIMQDFSEMWMDAITLLVSGFFIFIGGKLIMNAVFRSPEPATAPKRKINYRPRPRRRV